MSNSYGIQKIPNVYQCTDFRKKYWGWIKTCSATEAFTLKHIFMYRGSQSSLEYHVKKDENYYIKRKKILSKRYIKRFPYKRWNNKIKEF